MRLTSSFGSLAMLLAMRLARDMTAQRVGLKPVLEPKVLYFGYGRIAKS